MSEGDFVDRREVILNTLRACSSSEEALREVMLSAITLAAVVTKGNMLQAQLLLTAYADTVGGFPPPPDLGELLARWAHVGRQH